MPPDLDVHLILDNYSTHKTPLPPVVGQAPTLPSAFHADLFFVAQLGGTLVRGTDDEAAHAARRVKIGLRMAETGH